VALQELIFVLAKLKVEEKLIKDSTHSFLKYSKYEIDSAIVKDAFELCSKMNFYRNINDAIHLKFAEKYCKKLLTFDEDFKKFKSHSKLDIEIISVIPEEEPKPEEPTQTNQIE
jgi:predicted nucleic acid-binding protein